MMVEGIFIIADFAAFNNELYQIFLSMPVQEMPSSHREVVLPNSCIPAFPKSMVTMLSALGISLIFVLTVNSSRASARDSDV